MVAVGVCLYCNKIWNKQNKEEGTKEEERKR